MATLGQPKPKIYKSQNMVPEDMIWQYGKTDPNPYQVEWQLLLDAIRNNTPHNEAVRAGHAEVAALMGRIATHSGQTITWDQVMQSDFEFIKDIDHMTFDTPAPVQEGAHGIYPAPQPGITREI